MRNYLFGILFLLISCDYKNDDKFLNDYMINYKELIDTYSSKDYLSILQDTFKVINTDRFEMNKFNSKSEILDSIKLQKLDFNLLIRGKYNSDSSRYKDYKKYRNSLKYFKIGQLLINPKYRSIILLIIKTDFTDDILNINSEELLLFNISDSGKLLSIIKLAESSNESDRLSSHTGSLFSKKHGNNFVLYLDSFGEQLDMDPGLKVHYKAKMKIKLMDNGYFEKK